MTCRTVRLVNRRVVLYHMIVLRGVHMRYHNAVRLLRWLIVLCVRCKMASDTAWDYCYLMVRVMERLRPYSVILGQMARLRILVLAVTYPLRTVA